MKREDAIKFLHMKKVYVGKHSMDVQQILQNLSISPRDINDNIKFPFIYILGKAEYCFGSDLAYFNSNNGYTEISDQEILDIKLDRFSIGEIVYNPKDKKIGKITYIDENGGIFCDIVCNTNYNISMNSHYKNGTKIGNMGSLILADEKQINIYDESISYVRSMFKSYYMPINI